jgi:hypothetical protein
MGKSGKRKTDDRVRKFNLFNYHYLTPWICGLIGGFLVVNF